MFLLPVTREKISHKLNSFDPQEIQLESLVVTVVVESFPSKFVEVSDGFSIIESPLGDSSDDIMLLEVRYNKYNNSISISRPSVSGRAVYHHMNSEGEFFCSTHISMLRKAGVKIKENAKALPELFLYNHVMPPRTLYADIDLIIAGGSLRVKLDKDKCRIAEIKTVYDPPETNRSYAGKNKIDDILDNVLDLLNSSIRKLAPCKDSLYILFSGGLDSSILFKILQNQYKINTTLSTGFPFERAGSNLEKEYALSAAEAFGAKHIYHEINTPDYLRGFLEAISMAEYPIRHLQSVLIYLMARDAFLKEKKLGVIGLGADTVFEMDYYKYLFKGEKKMAKLLSRHPFAELINIASNISGRGHSLLKTISYSQMTSIPISNAKNPIWSINNFGSRKWTMQHFGVKDWDMTGARYEAIKSLEGRPIYDVMASMKLVGISFTQNLWDKLNVAHNQILYTPFADMDLMNFAFSIPAEIKLKNFSDNPKDILRHIARRLGIPESIITRPKSSFGVRAELWVQKGGVFEPLIPLAAKVFDERKIRETQSTDVQKSMIFWNILNYSIWKRLCINNEPLEALLDELSETTRA